MADQKESILLDVKIENAQAVQNIAKLKQEVENLRKAQQEEAKNNGTTTETYVRLNEQIKALNTQIAEQSRIIQAEAKESRNLEGSYNALSAQLAQLKQEYKAVATDEEREAILVHLKEVNDRLVELDAQQGVFVRNVGNYGGAIQEAFDKIGQAANDLGPAKDVLGKFGPEGQKAAAALDLLGKIMKATATYGKLMKTTQQAQTVATQAQTGAQLGLNAAMEANPIGLIIAAITALISIVQKLISIFSDASSQTEKFNKALEANAELIEQTQKVADFEARMAAAVGKSQAEQIEIRRKAAEEAVKLADAEVAKLEDIQKNGSRKERKAAKEVMEQALQQQKDAYDALRKLNEDATVQAAADNYKAEQDKLKAQEDANKRYIEKQKQLQKEREDAEKKRLAEEKAAEEALAAQREEMLKRTRSQYENEIAELEKKRDKEISIAGLNADELLAIEDHYAAAIKAVRDREQQDLENAKKAEQAEIDAKAEEARKKAEEAAAEREDLLKTYGVIAPDDGELEKQLNRLKTALDAGFLSEEEYTNAVSNLYQKMAQEKAASVVDMAQQTMSAMSSIVGAMEASENAEMQKYMEDNQEKQDALKSRLDAGLITQAEYDNQVAKLNAEQEKKKKELDLKQAKRQKAMAIMNATLNAAGAIIASLAQSPVAIGPIPNPAGIASLALATATGIAQIAAAAATPLPKASKGMLIAGPSHAQGGTLIEAEGGEAIINKRATSRFLPLLSRINQSTGGIPLYGSGGVVGDAKIEQAAAGQQMTDTIANTPIYVTVVDINEGQERLAKVVERKNY